MRATKLFSKVVMAAAIFQGAAVVAFAQTVRVPGTRVSLSPPPGFSLAQQYPGFEREEDQASIMVTELPTPATEMIKAMTAPALATRGMVLVSAQEATIDGRAARLLNVRQKTPDGSVLKSMLIAGDATTTIMIVGTCATGCSTSAIAEIRRSLLSATRGSSQPGAFEGLPFHVTPTSKLKLAQRVSNMLMFTESGTTGTPRASEALYLIGHSIGRGSLGDLRSFSEARAKQTAASMDVGNFTGRMIQVGGVDAFELEADAVDARSGAAMRIYQVIIPDGNGYFIAQGLVRADEADEMVPEFRAVTASFRRNN